MADRGFRPSGAAATSIIVVKGWLSYRVLELGRADNVTDWKSVFDQFGIKAVSRTDKDKGAYVPSDEQKRAIAAAGKKPAAGGGTGETIVLEVLGEAPGTLLTSSYYDSLRQGAGRTPETRMGRDINRWAKTGDEIVIGNIGGSLFAARSSATLEVTDIGRLIASKADPAKVLALALKAKGKPKRRVRMVNDFVRNPHVVAAALLRANGKCETPRCTHLLFTRDDGQPYLEVHHVVRWAKEGTMRSPTSQRYAPPATVSSTTASTVRWSEPILRRPSLQRPGVRLQFS